MFPADLAGSASGLVISVGYVGGLIGPVLVGYFADVTGGFAFIPILLAISSFLIAPIGFFLLREKAE